MEKNYSRHKCITVVSKLVIICNTKKLLRLSPLYDILSSFLMFNLLLYNYLHFLRDFPYLHFLRSASCCALHAQAI